jgi:large subunit ribosomal protein L7/L12
MSKKDDKEKLIEMIEKMSVLELAEVVKALEEKFNVKATPHVAIAPTGAPQVEKEEKKEEKKEEFDVVLKSYGDKKIPVIKVVREITDLGLKEAKELVESAPCNIKEKVTKEEAEKISKRIKEVGGVCEIK